MVKSKEQAASYLKNHETDLIIAGDETTLTDGTDESKIIRINTSEIDQSGAVSLAKEYFKGNH